MTGRSGAVLIVVLLLATAVIGQNTNYTNLASGVSSDGSGPSVATAALGTGTANNTTYLRGDRTWATPGGLPAGLIVMTLTSCPSGFSEVSALNGKFVLGTLAANSNVGGTGGADNITPAGTVAAPAFTGTPFTDIINHTHPVTDPGHSHGMDEGTTDGSGTFMDRSNAAAATSAVTNSATTGITTNNPVGGVASITPAGTNSAPAFTGTQFDNRPAFVRVIFCSKD